MSFNTVLAKVASFFGFTQTATAKIASLEAAVHKDYDIAVSKAADALIAGRNELAVIAHKEAAVVVATYEAAKRRAEALLEFAQHLHPTVAATVTVAAGIGSNPIVEAQATGA